MTRTKAYLRKLFIKLHVWGFDMYACFLKGHIVSSTQANSPKQAWVKLKKLVKFNLIPKVCGYYVEQINNNGSVK